MNAFIYFPHLSYAHRVKACRFGVIITESFTDVLVHQ